ncbi:MAG: hypothetical protein J6T39_02910, partial [Clostridia bacterium]|nr:hypothetical protein [Clostridia bacterium]
VLFALISISGALYGCGGKYDNLKITSNRDATGLQLILDDNDVDGGSSGSTGTITFYVTGIDEEIDIKFNYDQSIVKITNKVQSQNTTTITLEAINPGSCDFIAMTEAGGKTDTVRIDCVKKLKSMTVDPNYTPAIFNKAGSSLQFNNKKIVFEPSDTTQNHVIYYFDGYQPIGISLTEGGLLTLEGQTYDDNIVVTVQSLENPAIKDTINVHLIQPIGDEYNDGIDIVSLTQGVYKNGKITLTTDPEENSFSFSVDVVTDEDITLGFKLADYDDTSLGNADCIYVEKSGLGFDVFAQSAGMCKLIVEIHFTNYSDAPVSTKSIDVEVIQLPTTITVNGKNDDFSDDIYSYYQNGLGQQYTVTVGDLLAYDKQYFVGCDTNEVIVSKVDGTSLILANVYDDKVTDLVSNFTIMPSGSSIYVRGRTANTTSKLYIYAYGNYGHKRTLVRVITLSTYLGSTFVDAQNGYLDGRPTSTHYVEVGNTTEIKYNVETNTSSNGIRLVKADGTNIGADDIISVVVDDTENKFNPTITVTAKSEGSISVKLLLSNLVESQPFNIVSFISINYTSETPGNVKGGWTLKVDSPLDNKNIAEARYQDDKMLSSFVMSLGSGVAMNFKTTPENATIYGNVRYSAWIYQDTTMVHGSAGRYIEASDYLSVSNSGYVVAKKVLEPMAVYTYQGDEFDIPQTLIIRVEVTSFITNVDGGISTVSRSKEIELEIYVPLVNVTLSKTTSTIYWADT